jgi:ankyrin repeat protein
MNDKITRKFLNFKNKQGNTPLHEAYLNEKYEMEHLLRATEMCDDTIPNAKGQTCAHLEKLYEIKLMEEEMKNLQEE